MEIPVGLGGITLLVLAVLWLVIFVPGLSKRSQLKEASHIAHSEIRRQREMTKVTPQDQLRRLINTQRAFSALFGLFALLTVSSAVSSALESAWWLAFWPALVLTLFFLFVQRAAGTRANRLATSLHRSRQSVRHSAQRHAPKNQVSREWMPNHLPSPMKSSTEGEMLEPIAQVIAIAKPKTLMSSAEIDAILARRRAI
jgi:hypothetical protein